MSTPQSLRVIVVCTGNLNRSPFLAALLRRAGCTVISCGTSPGAKLKRPAAAKTRRMAEQYKLELSEHRTRYFEDVTPAEWDWADVVVGFNKNHVAAVKQVAPQVQTIVFKIADPGFMKPTDAGFDAVYEDLLAASKEIVSGDY
jgi:protein-tyrosine phosphatase